MSPSDYRRVRGTQAEPSPPSEPGAATHEEARNLTALLGRGGYRGGAGSLDGKRVSPSFPIREREAKQSE